LKGGGSKREMVISCSKREENTKQRFRKCISEGEHLEGRRGRKRDPKSGGSHSTSDAEKRSFGEMREIEKDRAFHPRLRRTTNWNIISLTI